MKYLNPIKGLMFKKPKGIYILKPKGKIIFLHTFFVFGVINIYVICNKGILKFENVKPFRIIFLNCKDPIIIESTKKLNISQIKSFN